MSGKRLLHKIDMIVICMKLLSSGEGRELAWKVLGAMGKLQQESQPSLGLGLVRVMVRSGRLSEESDA